MKLPPVDAIRYAWETMNLIPMPFALAPFNYGSRQREALSAKRAKQIIARRAKRAA